MAGADAGRIDPKTSRSRQSASDAPEELPPGRRNNAGRPNSLTAAALPQPPSPYLDSQREATDDPPDLPDAELPPGARLRPRDEPVGSRDVAGNIAVPTLGQRLRIPPSLPGAQAPQLHVPPSGTEHPELRNQVIDLLFPNLPPVWPLVLPRPTAERPALTLGELQDLAVRYNPLLIQARANVTSLLGDAIQSRTHPNPVVGYESDTVGSGGTRNYQGVYMSQLIVTANKLGLAGAAANVDVMNAQLAVRRTRLQVLADVKASYFALLVAQENLIVNDALVRFMEEVFRLQRSRLKAGQAAAFEAGQLRGMATLARNQLTLARNSYVAAWKTLAARLGLPQMPLSPVVGRADMPIPLVRYDAALARMLSVHPDIIIGRNLENKARYALKLEQVKPIPDVLFYGTVQKDFTTPGVRSTSYNTQVGLPLPIWNRNRGGILSARGDLAVAAQQWRVAQIDLTARLANAFSQYETNRYQVQQFLNHILPDYARAYRGVYEQHQAVPQVMNFEGIIVAQQLLATAVEQYIAALGLQWAAVADLSYLVQAETLEELSEYGGGQSALPALERVPLPPQEPDPRQLSPGREGGRQ